jgi:hypothetical protein
MSGTKRNILNTKALTSVVYRSWCDCGSRNVTRTCQDEDIEKYRTAISFVYLFSVYLKMDNWWMTNRQESGRRRLCPNLGYYPDTYMEERRIVSRDLIPNSRYSSQVSSQSLWRCISSFDLPSSVTYFYYKCYDVDRRIISKWIFKKLDGLDRAVSG